MICAVVCGIGSAISFLVARTIYMQRHRTMCLVTTLLLKRHGGSAAITHDEVYGAVGTRLLVTNDAHARMLLVKMEEGK